MGWTHPTGRPVGRPLGTPQTPETRARIAEAKLGVPHPDSAHERHVAAAKRRWADPAYREARRKI